MSILPKIDVPTYNVTLPVSNIQVKFRPYLVKEQKILSMAKQSGEKNALIEAILQVLNNCTQNTVDVYNLPVTDSEFYFYNLRARSESEIVNLKYRCESKIDGERCGNLMEYDLNLLTDLEIFVPDVKNTIEITDTVGLKLRHQRLEADNLVGKIPTPEEILELIANNIEFIYDENSQYDAKDIPVSQIVEWIGNLPAEKYKTIEEFFLNEPKIVKKLDLTCSKCGTNHNIVVEDIYDFFQ